MNNILVYIVVLLGISAPVYAQNTTWAYEKAKHDAHWEEQVDKCNGALHNFQTVEPYPYYERYEFESSTACIKALYRFINLDPYRVCTADFPYVSNDGKKCLKTPDTINKPKLEASANIGEVYSFGIQGNDGCGSRGGPGWRKSNGQCASWRD